jgi:hypothetical protein
MSDRFERWNWELADCVVTQRQDRHKNGLFQRHRVCESCEAHDVSGVNLAA